MRSAYLHLRRQVYHVLERPVASVTLARLSRIIDWSLVTIIVLNVIATIISSMEDVHGAHHESLYFFEVFSVEIFTAEYLLRLWACVENPTRKRPILGRLRMAFTPLMLIDFLAILPFFLPFVFNFDTLTLRAIRLLRLIRLLKLARYSGTMKTMGKVVSEKKEELGVAAFVMFIALVVMSSLMHLLEKDAQPEAFGSIPHAMWWSMSTLTTVGYGDVVPVTAAGRILASLTAVLGMGLFAIPAGIIGAGLLEEGQRKKRRNIEHLHCPHCGEPVILDRAEMLHKPEDILRTDGEERAKK